MLGTLVTTRFLLLYAFVASAVYVHLRGRVRHSFHRQLTDHSTVFAPLNVLMYVASAVPRTPVARSARLPRAERRCASTGARSATRREALLDADQVRPSERSPRRRLQHVLRTRLEALLSQVVRRLPAVRAGALPAHGRAAAVDPHACTPRSSRCCLPAGSWPSTAIPTPARCATTWDSSRPTPTRAASWSTASPTRGATARTWCSTRPTSIAPTTAPTRLVFILFCDVERPLRTPVMRAAEPVHRAPRPARHLQPQRADGAPRRW